MTITTVAEVRRVGQLGADFTDDEIQIEIDSVESDMYERYNLPKRSSFTIDSNYTDFYIYNQPVYEIKRVQVAVDTATDPTGYMSIGSPTYWSFTEDNKYLTLEASTISTYDKKQIRVQHIPKVYNRLASNQVAFNLVATTNIVDGNSIDTPLTTRIKDRLNRYKKLVRRKKFIRSSQVEDHNKYDYISYSQVELR